MLNFDYMQTKKKKGFTLIELVVAISIAAIISAIAIPFLLQHIKDAKVANVNENVVNIKSALNSYISKNGDIYDSDNDGDYLDELIKDGYISGNVNIPACSKWTIVKVTDSSNNEALVLQIDYDNCSSESQTQTSQIFKELDKNVDDDNSTGGSIRIIN